MADDERRSTTHGFPGLGDQASRSTPPPATPYTGGTASGPAVPSPSSGEVQDHAAVTAPAARPRGSRPLVLPLLAIPVTIALLVIAAIATRSAAVPPGTLLLLVIDTVLGLILAEKYGYDLEPVPPELIGEQARAQARKQSGKATLVRLACTFTPVLLAFWLSFTAHSFIPMVFALLICLPLCLWQTLPSRRATRKIQEALQRAGNLNTQFG